MPDKIHSNEQAAIDAYLASNEVTKCATGDTGAEETYRIVWDEKSNRLLYADKSAAKQRFTGKKRGHPITPEISMRRSKVQEYTVAGMTRVEIAKELGCPVTTVRSDMRLLGMIGERANLAKIAAE